MPRCEEIPRELTHRSSVLRTVVKNRLLRQDGNFAPDVPIEQDRDIAVAYGYDPGPVPWEAGFDPQ